MGFFAAASSQKARIAFVVRPGTLRSLVRLETAYPSGVQVLILCGGRGTRAWPATAEIPKPMLPIGGRPAIHHVMEIYAQHGFRDFVLAAGYRHEAIEAYATEFPTDWQVEVVNTGEERDTGDRVLACLDLVGDQFFITYGDGLGDVDIAALLSRHRTHGGGATVTVVPLPSQYGTLDVDADDRVREFREKPQLPDHLINAGFFVINRDSLDPAVTGSLERDILPDLGRRGELFVYRHSGFWRSMDTQKDIAELDQLATREGTPWLPRPSLPASVSLSPEHPDSSAHT
jgi:glucose-1-phosphate cytidylyltransferase